MKAVVPSAGLRGDAAALMDPLGESDKGGGVGGWVGGEGGQPLGDGGESTEGRVLGDGVGPSGVDGAEAGVGDDLRDLPSLKGRAAFPQPHGSGQLVGGLALVGEGADDGG